LTGVITACPLQEDHVFEDLISDFQPRLFAFVYSLTKDQAQAQDVMQNTNVILWKKREKFEIGSNFKAWAFQIAYFEAKQAKKKVIHSKELSKIDEDLMESLQAESYELDEDYQLKRNKLKDCLKKLPDNQKELIVDRYYGNESVQLMANVREVAANTMAKQLSRIRKTLMHCIEKKDKN